MTLGDLARGRNRAARPVAAGAFADALLDPRHNPPEGVVGPHGKGAVKRYNVYRNNVTVGLIEALGAIYPAVRRLAGEDFFRAMARAHVRTEPPRSPLLLDYGRNFPAFIEAYPHAQATPWLADVARIERAWLDSYHAADVAPLSTTAFRAVPPASLPDVILEAHPATRIVCSAYPACSIFAMARGEGEIVPVAATGPEAVLITRPDAEVTVRHLPPGGAFFLQDLIDGRPLGHAAATALDAAQDFDLPASIAGMLVAGVFTTLNLGDQQQ